MLLGLDEAGVKVESHPRIPFINVAANCVSMVHRQKAPFLKEPRALGHAVSKQRFDFAPITVGTGNSMRSTNDIGHVFAWAVDRGGVQFIVDEHGCHSFVRRNSLKRNAPGGSEPGGAAMAKLFGSLH